MTLKQLLALLAKIESLADKDGYLQGWKDIKGNPCHMDTVNLYDVVKYLVKPETAEKKCSYVELVAPPGTKAQTPKWFVSHWWGEPVKDFIMAVKEHARQRFAPRDDRHGNYGEPYGKPADVEATYWICAYAIEA